MPVGISLDDSQNITIGTDSTLNFLEIMPESGKINFNPGRARDRHGNLRKGSKVDADGIKTCDFTGCKGERTARCIPINDKILAVVEIVAVDTPQAIFYAVDKLKGKVTLCV
jgi:hypothetical protein